MRSFTRLGRDNTISSYLASGDGARYVGDDGGAAAARVHVVVSPPHHAEVAGAIELELRLIEPGD